jgi:hypothetical protein
LASSRALFLAAASSSSWHKKRQTDKLKLPLLPQPRPLQMLLPPKN